MRSTHSHGRWCVGAVACVVLLVAACTTGPSRQQRQNPATPSAMPTTTRPQVVLPTSPAPKLAGRIAFTAGDGDDVYTMNADGSNVRRLTHRPGAEFDPSWSPGGTRIVYRDSRRGINVNDEIYVMDADGRHQQNLSHHPANDWGPAWSRRGDLIAFSSDRVGGLARIFVMRPDGSGVRRLTDVEGEYPAWSPDGTKIAFMSMEPGAHGLDPDYNIRVMNADGSGLRRLTDYRGDDGWPAWSRDGRRIAFETTRDDPGGLAGADGPYSVIYSMHADGSGLARVTSLFSHTPTWSPDGRLILFSGAALPPAGFGLYVAHPDGSGAGRLAWPRIGDLFDPDWTA